MFFVCLLEQKATKEGKKVTTSTWEAFAGETNGEKGVRKERGKYK